MSNMTTEQMNKAREILEWQAGQEVMTDQGAVAALLLRILENQEILAREVARLGMGSEAGE